MAQEIARRLINGIWRTGSVEEDAGSGDGGLERRGPFTVAHDTVATFSGSGFRQFLFDPLALGEIVYDWLVFINTPFAGSDADSINITVGLYDAYFGDLPSGSLDYQRLYINYSDATQGPMYGPDTANFHHEAIDGFGAFEGGPLTDRRFNGANPMLIAPEEGVDFEPSYLCAELGWAGAAPTAGRATFYALVFGA